MLLGWICSFFALQEHFLVAENEMVVVGLGGVEGMKVKKLGFFGELRRMTMEFRVCAWRGIFLTLKKKALSWLYGQGRGVKGG